MVISRLRKLTKEGAGVSLFFFFFFFWGGGGGGRGEDYFSWSRFIKAISSIHMYIVGSSISHFSKYQTSKFFFPDFQS